MTEETARVGADSGVRNAVARALWHARLTEELGLVSEFSFDTNVLRLSREILLECDKHTFVITAFALISKCFDAGLRHHLRHGSKKDMESLLDGLGPLSSDSARIRLAKVLGWLPTDIAAGLNCLRTHRNRVAHEIVPVEALDLATLFPAELSGRFDLAIERMLAAANAELDKPLLQPTGQARSTAHVMMFAEEVLQSIVFGPANLGLRMSKNHRGAPVNFDGLPSWAQNLRREVADICFDISLEARPEQ